MNDKQTVAAIEQRYPGMIKYATYDEGGRIREIYLYGIVYTSLPSELWSLSSLQVLSLSSFHEMEQFPSEIEALTQLRTLKITGFRKLRTLPASLRYLKELVTLDLSGNHLEQFPTAVAALLRLRELSLMQVIQIRSGNC